MSEPHPSGPPGTGEPSALIARPDGAPTPDAPKPAPEKPLTVAATRDWRWVEQWRQEREPTPWGPGLALAGFAALVIGSAVYVISAGLADRPVFAVIANVVVAAGLSPALWMSRALPVLRWIALGGALGTVTAWISVLFFPEF